MPRQASQKISRSKRINPLSGTMVAGAKHLEALTSRLSDPITKSVPLADRLGDFTKEEGIAMKKAFEQYEAQEEALSHPDRPPTLLERIYGYNATGRALAVKAEIGYTDDPDECQYTVAELIERLDELEEKVRVMTGLEPPPPLYNVRKLNQLEFKHKRLQKRAKEFKKMLDEVVKRANNFIPACLEKVDDELLRNYIDNFTLVLNRCEEKLEAQYKLAHVD